MPANNLGARAKRRRVVDEINSFNDAKVPVTAMAKKAKEEMITASSVSSRQSKKRKVPPSSPSSELKNSSSSSSSSSSNSSSSNTGVDNKQCTICLENIGNVEGALNCNHSFCFGCIESWSGQENSCPLCKERFTYIDKKTMTDSQKKPTATRYSKRKRKSSMIDNGNAKVERVNIKTRSLSDDYQQIPFAFQIGINGFPMPSIQRFLVSLMSDRLREQGAFFSDSTEPGIIDLSNDNNDNARNASSSSSRNQTGSGSGTNINSVVDLTDASDSPQMQTELNPLNSFRYVMLPGQGTDVDREIIPMPFSMFMASSFSTPCTCGYCDDSSGYDSEDEYF